MSKKTRVVLEFLFSKIEECQSIERKIQLYEGLSEIMPTRAERVKVERIAWQYKQALAIQLDLFPSAVIEKSTHKGNQKKN